MTRSPQHPGHPYFTEIADRLGAAYLRYSFTKGTGQEVDFLLELMDLPPGSRVLDVGCGPGRHAIPLAKAGLLVTGVDVSARFLELARRAGSDADLGPALSLFECDARSMPFDGEFDVVISLCQGGFGLMGTDDALVLKRMAEAALPGGRVILTAFSAYFEAHLNRPGAHIDPDQGMVHEVSAIKDEAGTERAMDLWTSIYTPRELRLLAIGSGLVPEAVWSVEPGDYARRAPDIEHPEFLLVARKPK